MTSERWDQLVRRLERFAEERPAAYARRVVLLTGLGYAAILGVLAVLLAAVGGVVALFVAGHGNLLVAKLLIVLAVLTAIIARALWVKLPPPEGIELARHEAPALFDLVDEVRGQLDAPKVDRIFVDDELNASADQRPRFGPVGPQQHFLALGVPLMQALSTAELRSVVAHELGHFRGGHGRLGTWIYRVRETWDRLLEQLETGSHWSLRPMRAFFEWYAPTFGAWSFPLIRVQEYEADRAAAEVAGVGETARALTGIKVASGLMYEVYWPDLYDRVRTEPAPPVAPLAGLARLLPERAARPEASRWIDAALARATDTADTHPSLTDRLAALGPEAERAAQEMRDDPDAGSSGLAPSAATALLGPLEAKLLARLDQEWHERVSDAWADRHREAGDEHRRLEELDARAEGAELPLPEAHEQIDLALRLRGSEESLPLLRRVVERDPDHAGAAFSLGETLLGRSEEEGLEHLDRAVRAEPAATFEACELARSWLAARGRADEALAWQRRGDARHEEVEKARRERAGIGRFDRLAPHGLTPEEVEALTASLREHPDVARAYLARKDVKHLADEAPLHVLAVKPKRRRFTFVTEKRTNELRDRLADYTPFPSGFFVAVMEGPGKPIAKRVRGIEGSEILRRR